MLKKVSDLIGAELDYAVAVAEGEDYSPKITYNGIGLEYPATEYSTNWSQGGPITEREGIYLRKILMVGHKLHGNWLAAPADGNTGTRVQWIKRESWPRHYFVGPTLLIAAMRCYVASKFGDMVEIPDEIGAKK